MSLIILRRNGSVAAKETHEKTGASPEPPSRDKLRVPSIEG